MDEGGHIAHYGVMEWMAGLALSSLGLGRRNEVDAGGDEMMKSFGEKVVGLSIANTLGALVKALNGWCDECVLGTVSLSVSGEIGRGTVLDQGLVVFWQSRLLRAYGIEHSSCQFAIQHPSSPLGAQVKPFPGLQGSESGL